MELLLSSLLSSSLGSNVLAFMSADLSLSFISLLILFLDPDCVPFRVYDGNLFICKNENGILVNYYPTITTPAWQAVHERIKAEDSFRSFLMTLNDIKFEEYVEKPFHRISAQKQETIEVKPSVVVRLDVPLSSVQHYLNEENLS